MPLNTALVGHSYPPGPVYEVGREKIREFADSLGDLSPVYRDPAAARALGYPDVIAPPTFAAVISIGAAMGIAADPDLGLNYQAIVHRDQAFHYHRPIRAGDRLRAVVHIDELRSISTTDMMVTRIEISTEDGEAVVTATCALVSRSAEAPVGVPA